MKSINKLCVGGNRKEQARHESLIDQIKNVIKSIPGALVNRLVKRSMHVMLIGLQLFLFLFSGCGGQEEQNKILKIIKPLILELKNESLVLTVSDPISDVITSNKTKLEFDYFVCWIDEGKIEHRGDAMGCIKSGKWQTKMTWRLLPDEFGRGRVCVISVAKNESFKYISNVIEVPKESGL